MKKIILLLAITASAINAGSDPRHATPEAKMEARMKAKMEARMKAEGEDDRKFQLRNVPDGSYKQTCQVLDYDENTLTCRCLDSSGIHAEKTQIDASTCKPNTIDNINGKLRCSLK